MKTLLLLDGSSYLYRAYHALPDLRTAAGEPTGYVLARDAHELTLEAALGAYDEPVEELLASLPDTLRDNLGALVGRLRENRRTTLAGRSIIHLLG